MDNPHKLVVQDEDEGAAVRLVREAVLLEGAEAQAAWLRENTQMCRLGYWDSGLELQLPLYTLKGVTSRSVLVQLGGRIVEIGQGRGATRASEAPRLEMERELTDAEWREVLSVPAVQERYGLDGTAEPNVGFFKRHGKGLRSERSAGDPRGACVEYRIVAPIGGSMLGLRLVREEGQLRLLVEVEQVLDEDVAAVVRKPVG